MLKLYTSSGTSIVLGEELARGGEGTIYAVEERTDQVAKLYGPTPHPGYEKKLLWMKTHPPQNSQELKGAVVLAWPLDLLYNEDGECLGYLMKYIQDACPVLDIFNPRRRMQKFPEFHRKLIYQTAKSIALTLSSLHDRGYVVGDLNESNILVTKDGLITMIDNDSFQVQEVRRDGIVVYPCRVGKPDYTPPELQGQALGGVLRRPEHDNFSLSVLLFQMLMEGNHPFRSRWRKSGEPPILEEKINLGYFPYNRKYRRFVLPPPNAPTLKILYPKVETLFRRCFSEGVHDMRMRPTAQEWANALAEAEEALVCCSQGHYFSNHLLRCPDCTELESAVSQSWWLASAVPLSFSLGNSVKIPRPMGRVFRLTSAVVLSATILFGAIVMSFKWWQIPQIGQENKEGYTVSTTPSTMYRRALMITNRSSVNLNEKPVDSLQPMPVGPLDENEPTESFEDKEKIETKTILEQVSKDKESRSEPVRKKPVATKRTPKTNEVAKKAPCKISTETIGRLAANHSLQGHGAAVACLSYSPSGDYLATGSLDATARLWRISDGQAVQTYKDQKKVLSVAFSPDGKMLASSSKSISLWSTDEADEAPATSLDMKRTTLCLAYSPDGKVLASGSTDNKARIWSVDGGEPLFILAGHTGNVNCIAFSPNGQILATGSNDNSVRLWNVQDGTLIHTLRDRSWSITSLAFSPDGRYIAAGSRDFRIRLWTVGDGSLERTFRGHEMAVTCVSFSPDGKMLVSGSNDQTLRLWQVSDGESLKTFNTEHPIRSLSFAPNGTSVASGLSNGTILIWSLSSS